MAQDDEDRGDEAPYDLRLSFRSYRRNMPKLNAIAQRFGFITKSGRTNVSAVLNHIIEKYELPGLPASVARRVRKAGDDKST